MRRGLLSGCCAWTLSLLLGWGAQAQTTEPNPLTPFPSVPLVAPYSSPTPPGSGAVDLHADEVPEGIARQRQALAAQRSAIEQVEAAQQTVCWQKFAVNACLSEARRARRLALEPLRQQELALNAQERLWRTEQRERRLQGKQLDTRKMP